MSYSYERPEAEHSPEVTLALSQLFDDVRSKVATVIENGQATTTLATNTASLAINFAYPKAEIIQTSSAACALYSSQKDVTSVIDSATCIVDGELKEGYRVSFFKGAPFGHVFDPTDSFLQFEPLTNRKTDTRQSDAELEKAKRKYCLRRLYYY